jgi:tRNA modification GTPase
MVTSSTSGTVSSGKPKGGAVVREAAVAALEALAAPSEGLHSQRQLRCVQEAAEAVGEARAWGLEEPVLAAEALGRAGEALEELVGRWGSEEVLDELFATFCIGK